MKQTFMVVLAAAVLVGCATSPVYNVDGHATPMGTQKLPLDRIERAIIEAGERRGWQFEHVEPGHLLATLARRQHKAAADVLFTRTKYSIVYKSSVGLQAENGVIHRNYNKWIKILAKDIWDELLRITSDQS